MPTRSLDIGATGMLAQQMNVDVISQNIANMTTTGYKRRHVAFQDLLYQMRLENISLMACVQAAITASLKLRPKNTS